MENEKIKYIRDLTPDGQAQQIHNLYSAINYLQGKVDGLSESFGDQKLYVEKANNKLLQSISDIMKNELNEIDVKHDDRLNKLNELYENQQKEIDILKNADAVKSYEKEKENKKLWKGLFIGTGGGVIITWAIQNIITLITR